MQDLAGLQDLTLGAEHGRLRQTELDQLQAHEPVVDVTKLDARELDHVDLDAPGGQVVEQ